MKLTEVEKKVLKACHPNAGNTVLKTGDEHRAMDALLKLGFLRKEKVISRTGSAIFYYATKAGRALLKQLKGS